MSLLTLKRVTSKKLTTSKRTSKLHFKNALVAFSFIIVQVLTPVTAFVLSNQTAVAASNQPGDVASQSVPGQSVTTLSTPVPATNPSLGQSCGLDIALVIDNSASISSGELSTMKTAMKAFTSAFNGTPTQFSVTKFNTTASVQQSFTANISSVNTAIDSIGTSSGHTNWEDGLLKAKGTFDPRATVPNMVIFASDGNPNTVDNGTFTTETDAVDQAITMANSLKVSPLSAHMLALGIGNDLDTANLQAISGPGDVISSDFSSLATDLATLAESLCGGTITTTKLIDQDGNLNTTGDQTPAADWSFDVNGSPSNPDPTSTDVNGQTPAVKVDNGTYSVVETQKAGYQLLKASCTGASNNGSQSSNSVTGVQIASNSIVSCTFINSPTPTLTLVKTVVNNNGGTKTANDFQAKIDGNNVAWSTAIPMVTGAHTASEVSLPTYLAGNWGGDCAANGSVSLTFGQNKTCTITNDDIAPGLTVNKVVVNPYGNPLATSAFPLYVDGTSVASGVKNTQFGVGNHTVSEDQQFGYARTNVTGDCTLNTDVISVILNLGQNYVCTITNTAIQPKLIVKKHVVNNNYGTKQASDFSMTVSGNSISVPNFSGDESGTTVLLNEGNYTVGEASHVGYDQTLSADCSGTISVGQEKVCTITNNDTVDASIHVVKSGPATAHEGDTVTYTFAVSNTGSTPLSGLTIGDSIVSGVTYQSGDTNNDGFLQPSETWYYGADYLVPADQTDNIINTVTVCSYADGTTSTTKDGPVCNTDQHTLDVLHPHIHVVKSGPASAHEGDTVTYNFTVTNTGDTALTVTDVDDTIAGSGTYISGDTNNNNRLDTSETWIYHASYLIPQDQTNDVSNAVTVCATDTSVFKSDLSHTASLTDILGQVTPSAVANPSVSCDTDSHTLDILHPSLIVSKYGPATAHEGDTVTYNFKVKNTGDVTLHNVSINDDLATGETCDNTTLTANQETWCTAIYTIPTPQLTDVTNHVIASGIDPLDQTVTASAQHTLVVLHPAIHVVKKGPASAYAGTTVTYTFTVTNTGNVPVDQLTVEDSITGAATYVSGDTNHNNVLDQTETWLYNANYTIPTGQTSDVTNTVTVCSSEQLQEDEVIEQLTTRISNQQIVRPGSICAHDSHTLTITKPVVPITPQTLAPTGESTTQLLVVVTLLNIVAVLGYTYNRQLR